MVWYVIDVLHVGLPLHLMCSKSLANIMIMMFTILESIYIPSARYSTVCNVLCLCSTCVIPI